MEKNRVFDKEMLISMIDRKVIQLYEQMSIDCSVPYNFLHPKRKALKSSLANEEIKRLIKNDNPIMVSRYGSTELYTSAVFELRIRNKYDYCINQMFNLSGFFPKDEFLINEFVDLFVSSNKDIDLLGVWSMPFENYFIKKYLKKDAMLTYLRNLEPWFYDDPWTKELEGKKVLVIHPFKETIINQYKKRQFLFKNEDVLPCFDLKVLKAVQTIGGNNDNRFSNWFDALNYMYEETTKIDFEIALIGCGAYGLPLAAKIKRNGKKAIHMGGCLQILFGIKGNRWEKDNRIQSLYNDYWSRPNQNETPKNSKKIEDGCYW